MPLSDAKSVHRGWSGPNTPPLCQSDRETLVESPCLCVDTFSCYQMPKYMGSKGRQRGLVLMMRSMVTKLKPCAEPLAVESKKTRLYIVSRNKKKYF